MDSVCAAATLPHRSSTIAVVCKRILPVLALPRLGSWGTAPRLSSPISRRAARGARALDTGQELARSLAGAAPLDTADFEPMTLRLA